MSFLQHRHRTTQVQRVFIRYGAFTTTKLLPLDSLGMHIVVFCIALFSRTNFEATGPTTESFTFTIREIRQNGLALASWMLDHQLLCCFRTKVGTSVPLNVIAVYVPVCKLLSTQSASLRFGSSLCCWQGRWRHQIF